jgi:DNA-binding XRE family transcriptional regulator
MPRNPNQHKNQLAIYRRRMGYSQKQAASLIGHRGTSMLSRYESGRSLPPLLTALRLEILYRTPVAFLYVGIYKRLKDEMRSAEEQMAGRGQLALF